MSACTHVFELAMRRPPTRMQQGTPGDASARYFGAGAAYEEMNRLLGVLVKEGALPQDVSLGGEFEAESIERVSRHLLSYWSPKPPERGSARHAANARLSIVGGFERIVRVLNRASEEALDFSSSGSFLAIESWVAENASDGGYGAVVPAAQSDWLKVGSLIGIMSEGEKHWGAGIVRRIVRDNDQSRRIGMQLFSRIAIPVRLAQPESFLV